MPCLFSVLSLSLSAPSQFAFLCLSLLVSSLLPPPLLSFSASSPSSLPASRSPSPLQASEKEKESPVELTERCFRELLGRAAYGNIKNAVTPVLMWDNQTVVFIRNSLCLWCVPACGRVVCLFFCFFLNIVSKLEDNAACQAHLNLYTNGHVGLWQGQCKVMELFLNCDCMVCRWDI